MENLRDWFTREKRSFPWRENKTPYRVWISEIMLQQTRSAVVIDYYERWMARFPDIHTLARADEDEVIKLWEGLGYYSRARNILAGAKMIVEQFGGEMPSTLDKLLTIKGIGDYTAGAILSFAFNQRGLALDGNVMRVISRLFAYDKDVRVNIKEVRSLLDQILPHDDPQVAMEGLIELGSQICNKKPVCHLCPLLSQCKAFEMGMVSHFPKPAKKTEITKLYRFVPCIWAGLELLLKKGEEGKVMAGLWEFPYFETEGEPLLSTMQHRVETLFSIKLDLIEPLPFVHHHFTKYKAHLYPYAFQVIGDKVEIPGYVWVSVEEVAKLSFSSGHKKIIKQCCQEVVF